MRVNFVDFKPNHEKNEKNQFDPIVFTTMHANLIMKLRELTPYPPRSPIVFEDYKLTQQVFYGNDHYNTMKYATIPVMNSKLMKKIIS